MLIEFHGDYWHCNPKIYTNGPINDWQRKAIKRDFAKKAAAKHEGYYQITVWEKDFREKPEHVREWLLSKISQNYEVIKNGTDNFN